MTADLQYSTTVDAAVTNGGLWTTISPTSGGTATATSGSFTKITGVFAVPSTAKSLMVRVYSSASISSGVSLYVAQAQLELGSVATAFSRAGGTLQGELAACQRYYYRINANTSYANFGVGQAYNTTAVGGIIPFPVSMRIVPTSVEQTGTAGNYGLSNSSATVIAATVVPSLTTYFSNTSGAYVVFATSAGGLSAGNASIVSSYNNFSAFLGFSAEL
jgi:hypothetical protein